MTGSLFKVGADRPIDKAVVQGELVKTAAGDATSG